MTIKYLVSFPNFSTSYISLAIFLGGLYVIELLYSDIVDGSRIRYLISTSLYLTIELGYIKLYVALILNKVAFSSFISRSSL